MEGSLVFTLAGYSSAFGSEHAKDAVRTVHDCPTQSVVFGLIAACLGLRRENLDEALNAEFKKTATSSAVLDYGRLAQDYHTARPLEKSKNSIVTKRDYRNNAFYYACIESDNAFLKKVQKAMNNPQFTPYLGRRSCALQYPLYPRLYKYQDNLIELFQNYHKELQGLFEKSEMRDLSMKNIIAIHTSRLIPKKQPQITRLVRDKVISFDKRLFDEREDYCYHISKEA